MFFNFVMLWAVIASILAALFYAQIDIEKEKLECSERAAEGAREEKEALRLWYQSSQPAKELESALNKVALLERENKDLKEQIETLTFEKEELRKKLSGKSNTYTLYQENFNELL